MSYLDELRLQAHALRQTGATQVRDGVERTRRVDEASHTIWRYLDELAEQLEVIQPDGPALSVDGKTRWPAMRLVDFRVDARKKQLRGHEVFDYVVIHWRIVPRTGAPVPQSVRVNFPPDLERVQKRLSIGAIANERKDVRRPGTDVLLAYDYEYLTASIGGITVTARHDDDALSFQLLNLDGFGTTQVQYPAQQISHVLLDELAKRITGRPSRFA